MAKGSFEGYYSVNSTLKWFSALIVLSQLIGVVAIIILAVLLGHYRGGFAWTSNIAKEFNYHPLFMTLGMIFFYGDAILAYRIFRNVEKRSIKILHASLLALSLILSSIGLKAVFDNHNLSNPPKANLHTLHSWIGLATVILFGLQWVAGFAFFLFPKASENLRQRVMPGHKFLGKVIFCLAIGSVLMGITEYSIFNSIYSDDTIKIQRNMVNVYGLLVVTFGVLILYIVGHPGYQRPPDSEIKSTTLTN